MKRCGGLSSPFSPRGGVSSKSHVNLTQYVHVFCVHTYKDSMIGDSPMKYMLLISAEHLMKWMSSIAMSPFLLGPSVPRE